MALYICGRFSLTCALHRIRTALARTAYIAISCLAFIISSRWRALVKTFSGSRL